VRLKIVRSTVRSRPQPHIPQESRNLEHVFTMSYTDKSGTDGTGAQVFRYAITYELSKKYSLKWRHNPIVFIDENPSDKFAGKEEKKQYLEKLNSKICPDESLDSQPIFKCTIDKTINPHKLRLILNFCKILRFLPPIIDISLYRPQSYLSLVEPDLDRYFSSIRKNFRVKLEDSDAIKIIVHIRGALKTDRRTKPQLIHSILQHLQRKFASLEREIKFVIITDLPRFPKTWQVNISNDPGTIAYLHEMGLIDPQGFCHLDSFDFETKFDDIRNLTIERQSDPIESWEMMAGANLLIGCDSSLSIIGAHLNTFGIKMFPRNLSGVLPRTWFFYDNNSKIESSDLTMIYQELENLVNDEA
jgi:hypothetical protein